MPEENTFSLTVSTYPFHYSLLSICAYLQVCEKNLYDKLSQPPKNNKIDDESETRAHIRMSIMLLENSKRVVMCGGVEKQFCNNIFHAYTIYTCRHRENLIFELILCFVTLWDSKFILVSFLTQHSFLVKYFPRKCSFFVEILFILHAYSHQ